MKKSILLSVAIFITSFISVQAQDGYALLSSQYEENKAVIDALVLYPEDIRLAMFTVSQSPSLIVRVDKMQQMSSAKFATIIDKYSESLQEQFYDLSRYPGLIKVMLIEKSISDARWKDLLAPYPDEIHETARKLGTYEFQTLMQIDQLNEETQATFNKMLSFYPEVIANAARKLTETPEVMSMLGENVDLLILIGDVYKVNPQWLINKADSMHSAVASENAKAMQAWADELENDPEAMKELEQASKDYADEYNYDEEDYRQENEITVNVIYTYRPYHYWYGYPYWHTYGWWYPYPYWYHWGYYYSYPGTVVVIGLPSFHFCWWFLHHHHHWYHYPYLMHHVFHHHYSYPRTHVGLHVAVNEWERENHSIVGKDWLKDEKTRMDRIKEYSTFNKDYENFIKEKPMQEISKADYLTAHKDKYPSMVKPKIKPSGVIYPGKSDYPKSKSTQTKPDVKSKTDPPVVKPKPRYYPEKKHDKLPRTQPKKTYYPKKEIKVNKPVVKPKLQVKPKPKPKNPINKSKGRE